jgi:cell division protein FtsW
MLRLSKNFDWVFLFFSFCLLIFGILILASVSSAFSTEKVGNPYYFLKSQIIKGVIPGLILAFFAFSIELEIFKKFSFAILILNLILMGLVFLPNLGVKRLGAARWIDLKFFTLQPSEFLKLSSILYFSAWLSNKERKGKKESLIAFLIVSALIGSFLVLQPDISTLAIIILVSILIYFAAGNPIWHSLFMVLGGVLIGTLLIKLEPYRMNRILAFLNPENYPTSIGYQIKQALIAVGSGGIFGRGLGMSKQKFGFLPQSISDSIFAIFAEETGFAGCTTLIFLFLLFFWRGFKIAKEAKDEFSKLLAFGITSWIAIQTLINVSSMIRLLPLMGVPLPFVSYGGSALVSELIGVGFLLNISKT